MPSAAEEAIARAKAIAARLAGTAAVSATTPQASAAPVPPPAGASSTYYAPAAAAALDAVKTAALNGENAFYPLMNAARVCSLGQLTQAFFEVGGKYRRGM